MVITGPQSTRRPRAAVLALMRTDISFDFFCSGVTTQHIVTNTQPTHIFSGCVTVMERSACVGQDRDVPYDILSGVEDVPLLSKLLVPHTALDTHHLHKRFGTALRHIRDTFLLTM